jgi:Protein of unknown function (DUF3109).
VDGQSGAPVDESEIAEMEREYPKWKVYMTPEGIEAVESQAVVVKDIEGEWTTPLIERAECAYTYEEDGVTLCAIEKAFADGVTTFRKPVSCHLYPIRVKNFSGGLVGVNYDRWDICGPARILGTKLGLPVYKFLKEPIIRKFGEEFYQKMDEAYQMLKLEEGDE